MYWEKISQNDLGVSMGAYPAYRNLGLTGVSPISAGNDTSRSDSKLGTREQFLGWAVLGETNTGGAIAGRNRGPGCPFVSLLVIFAWNKER